jgi:4-hydroxy-tetrahydrodipicolinate synthase
MKLLPLHKLLFAEPNPIPVKWALARMGRCGGTLRLPLTPMSDALHAPLEQALHDAGVL